MGLGGGGPILNPCVLLNRQPASESAASVSFFKGGKGGRKGKKKGSLWKCFIYHWRWAGTSDRSAAMAGQRGKKEEGGGEKKRVLNFSNDARVASPSIGVLLVWRVQKFRAWKKKKKGKEKKKKKATLVRRGHAERS